MNFYPEYTNEDSARDGYPQFELSLQHVFNKAINSGKKLFTTNAEGLYELYLGGLPKEARQHYTCSACRDFINRYGGLVALDEKGRMESALWNEEEVPLFFKPSVLAMKKHVEMSSVNGVFLPDAKKLGLPKTGEWTHLHVELPREMIHRNLLRSAYQDMAEKREEFGMVTRAVLDPMTRFTQETVEEALQLIDAEVLYRGERAKPNILWLKELIDKVNSTSGSTTIRNIVWYAVATAPTGFTHIRSSAAGTLLKNIQDGLSVTEIADDFRRVMDPGNYQRSQSGPSTAAIYEAEQTVEKLGISQSLRRRYARYEEIPQFLWEGRLPKLSKVVDEVKQSSVFGHLQPKAKETSVKGLDIPAKLMTWEKFQREVLPGADSIELLVDNPNRFMALVTAADPLAPNILQWNNPFSWYYHGGVDGEIKRRVEEAGGRYENNEIRASLIWEGYTDLDLHCMTPGGDHIFYGRKQGILDVDANGGGAQTTTPVENMRWPSNAREGMYRFYVHNYAQRGKGPVPYRVELEVNGQIFTFDGVASGTGYQEDVFVFNYTKGQTPVIQGRVSSSAGTWNAEQNQFAKVKGITTSPNLWGENPNPHSGTHIFFLVEDVKDTTEGKGRGFFNEMLNSDLKPIRRTLELFTAQTPIEGIEEASAAGIGYSKDNEWGVTLRVTSGGSTRNIKIDRWD